jgi:hypothetical protein
MSTMARVSVATPGRSVTTYQSGKKDSASRRPRSALKNIIIKPSLKVKQTSASRAIKNRKAVTEASSQSDECSTDGSGSGDSGSDEAKGQEEEFDPELRSLVYKCEYLISNRNIPHIMMTACFLKLD